MTPASGARSGTRPSRPTPAAPGPTRPPLLVCGHPAASQHPAVTWPGHDHHRKDLYTCSNGCGLHRRKQ